MINLELLLIGILQMIYGLYGFINYNNKYINNNIENSIERNAYIILCICGAILFRTSKILYENGYFNFM